MSIEETNKCAREGVESSGARCPLHSARRSAQEAQSRAAGGGGGGGGAPVLPGTCLPGLAAD